MTDDIERRIAALLETMGVATADGAASQLFSSGRLDSLDLVQIIVFVEREFGVKIPPFEARLEQFDSSEAIALLVARYRR